MKKLKKYTLINIIFILLGMLIGTLALLLYQYHGARGELQDRDKTLSFLHETSLLINENQLLHEEITSLQEEIQNSKSAWQIQKNTKENIEKFESLLGQNPITGQGISLMVKKELPYFEFIDITNDIFTLGAEAIQINDIRITSKSSFTQNTLTSQVFISHKPIAAPYVIEVIGDSQKIMATLAHKNSFLKRLTKAYGLSEDDILVEKQEEIIMN